MEEFIIALDALDELIKQKQAKLEYHEDRVNSLNFEIISLTKKAGTLREAVQRQQQANRVEILQQANENKTPPIDSLKGRGGKGA